ncbi:GNAT family N-acetyltransferase [Paracoccus sp. 11-3]|uniref:GNAT family N-acetyltransferase n=1 Tax=Paracoccus amoyensis TaxID=2760093 RepID=A0A926GEG7_9RHOB|nr:GNAT family N-acetyltransferase [Paracoccus amoyensis]MBC9247051.1 GNAT family N-acetyltransferase [Paracoccus amoyensis]
MSCACGHHHPARPVCAVGKPVTLATPLLALSGRLICADTAQMLLAMDLLPDHVRLSRAEPGCLRFDIAQDSDPLIWNLSELFINRAAFEAHQDRTAASTWGQNSKDLTRDYTRHEVDLMIRPETPADVGAIDDLLQVAFEGRDEARLVRALRDQGDLPISLVVEAEGYIIGHIALSPLTAEQPAYALAPLAVHPKAQRLGIGGALIDEAMARTGETPIVVLGDPAYYARFGFKHADLKSPYAGPYLQIMGDLPVQCEIHYASAFAEL